MTGAPTPLGGSETTQAVEGDLAVILKITIAGLVPAVVRLSQPIASRCRSQRKKPARGGPLCRSGLGRSTYQRHRVVTLPLLRLACCYLPARESAATHPKHSVGQCKKPGRPGDGDSRGVTLLHRGEARSNDNP